MSDPRPRREDYVDLHEWAQAVKVWNKNNNATSDDIVRQWNKERNTSG